MNWAYFNVTAFYWARRRVVPVIINRITTIDTALPISMVVSFTVIPLFH